METKMFKITAILLMLAGNFFPCGCSESAQNPNYEKISPCHPDAIYVYMPWMDAIISEWLEGGVHGRIYQCSYKDGRGYLFETLEVSDDFKYNFRTCEGVILYEGEINPIDIAKFNIKEKRVFLGIYTTEEKSDNEIACDIDNPFTKPDVKQIIEKNIKGNRFAMLLYQISYNDGSTGFYIETCPFCAGNLSHYDFFNCEGNLSYSINFRPGAGFFLDIGSENMKLIFEFFYYH